jgi:hypothetical protein
LKAFYATMPSTHLTSPSHSTPSATRERVRTGIIVSVVVGTLAILILAYVLVKRRMNRGIKAGMLVGKKSYVEEEAGRRGKDDVGLEIGIVEEPLPVYVKDEGGRVQSSRHGGVRC